MKELKDYYETWKRRMLILSLICWLILLIPFNCINENISNVLANWIANPNIPCIFMKNETIIQQILNLLLGYAAPTSITIGLYYLILNYIDTKRWKKKFPQYDVDGEWSDVTTYTKQLDGSGWKSEKESNVPSPVRIKQTCQKIEVMASIGEDFKWHSLLADWDYANKLNILYKVEYYGNLQEKGYPECRIGYESMDIYTTDLKGKQRPRKMVGQFWHCLSSDGKPMFMGDVVYKRDLPLK